MTDEDGEGGEPAAAEPAAVGGPDAASEALADAGRSSGRGEERDPVLTLKEKGNLWLMHLQHPLVAIDRDPPDRVLEAGMTVAVRAAGVRRAAKRAGSASTAWSTSTIRTRRILRNFVTERGKMISARSTGNCAKHHRMLTRAIKRARNLRCCLRAVYGVVGMTERSFTDRFGGLHA